MKAILCKKLIPCNNLSTKDNAVIIIENQVITGIKSKAALKNIDAKNIINADKLTVLPGLIDCHTHLVFGGNRADEFEQRLNGVDYQEIARNPSAEKQNTGGNWQLDWNVG